MKLVGTAFEEQSKATIKTRSDAHPDRKLTKQDTSRGWNTLLLDMCGALQGPGMPGSFDYHELNLHSLAEGWWQAAPTEETGRTGKDTILPACLFMGMVWGQTLGIFLNGENQVLCIYAHALQKWS